MLPHHTLPVLSSLLIVSSAVTTAQSATRARGPDPALHLVQVSNGFGPLLPHRVPVPDANGQPTAEVIEIRSLADLANVRPTNPILPVAGWPTAALLPSAQSGNHFVLVRFDRALDAASVLPSTGVLGSGPAGAIQVEAIDPSIPGGRRIVSGRAFVGGQTYGATNQLETWIEAEDAETLVAVDPRGLGFPGTQTGFTGAALLVEPDAFVFVPDADGDLSTHETFPANAQIRVVITKQVRAASGEFLATPGIASSTVGLDRVEPEVLRHRDLSAAILPANGATGADPATNVQIRFSEPIQPLTVGPLVNTPSGLSSSVELVFGPIASPVSVPFTVRPLSVFDFTTYVIDPAFDFPGAGGGGFGCSSLSTVEVRVHAQALADLGQNENQLATASFFATGPGPGLVNAPVAPDTIYVARGGAHTGISVIDLNGFGAGTGNPTYDLAHPIVEGNSNLPNNPNLAIQGALLVPPLFPGTCTFNGGSAGVFTLTKDTNLADVLAPSPVLSSVADMALGHALDITFNNGAPFGCQAGGGNLCASTGLKRALLIPGGPHTLASGSGSPGTLPIKIVVGSENLVSWAPHPNPPPLVFPPLCQSPLILGQEPTSIQSALEPPDGPGLTNLLAPGDNPLGNPSIGLPPTNLLSPEQNAFFEGPSTPQPLISACRPYAVRQQIGQFLYAADRERNEVVVLDSNRFLVLDRIAVQDPTSFAMSPNLDLLAISSESTDRVYFLDTDPASARFHEIVHETEVGEGPRGLAWESADEDIFVCCTAAGSVSVISAFNLEVRKTLTAHLEQPIDIALTPRQTSFGFLRGVYFGYVLDAAGFVAVFESGPDGINGIGFDDIVATLPFPFHSPHAIQPDVTNLNSGFFVAHQDPLDENGALTGAVGGALTRVGIVGGLQGPIPLVAGETPHLRKLQLGVLDSIGEGPGGLSGVPVDIAFDDQRNVSALTNFSTTYSAGQPISINGKGLVRVVNGGALSVSAPQFVFAAVPETGSVGVVDVLDLHAFERFDTNVFQAGVQSIPAPGVTALMDYFRQ